MQSFIHLLLALRPAGTLPAIRFQFAVIFCSNVAKKMAIQTIDFGRTQIQGLSYNLFACPILRGMGLEKQQGFRRGCRLEKRFVTANLVLDKSFACCASVHRKSGFT
jgi:hypothetical protein